MSEQDQLFPDLATYVADKIEERVLDRKAAQDAALDGMDKAIHAARVQTWKITADAWLERMAVGRRFTNDHLYIEIGNPSDEQNRNNVVGAWINARAREGRIEHTGQSVKSQRKSRHANRVGVWRKVR